MLALEARVAACEPHLPMARDHRRRRHLRGRPPHPPCRHRACPRAPSSRPAAPTLSLQAWMTPRRSSTPLPLLLPLLPGEGAPGAPDSVVSGWRCAAIRRCLPGSAMVGWIARRATVASGGWGAPLASARGVGAANASARMAMRSSGGIPTRREPCPRCGRRVTGGIPTR